MTDQQYDEWPRDKRELFFALEEALAGLEDMISYVPEFFREKHDHQGCIDRARAALERVRSAEWELSSCCGFENIPGWECPREWVLKHRIAELRHELKLLRKQKDQA